MKHVNVTSLKTSNCSILPLLLVMRGEDGRWMTRALWCSLGSYWPSMKRQENFLLPVTLDRQPWWSSWSDVGSRQCWRLGSQAGHSWMERTFIMWLRTDVQLKTYSLFTSWIFHLIFLDLSWRQVTETLGSKTANKWGRWLNRYISLAYIFWTLAYQVWHISKLMKLVLFLWDCMWLLKLLAVNVLVSCLWLKATKVAFFLGGGL